VFIIDLLQCAPEIQHMMFRPTITIYHCSPLVCVCEVLLSPPAVAPGVSSRLVVMLVVVDFFSGSLANNSLEIIFPIAGVSIVEENHRNPRIPKKDRKDDF